jgi:hypothetical protein
MKGEKDRESQYESGPADLELKDYVALLIAMAETTMLPLILLAIVLAVVGVTVSVILFR